MNAEWAKSLACERQTRNANAVAKTRVTHTARLDMSLAKLVASATRASRATNAPPQYVVAGTPVVLRALHRTFNRQADAAALIDDIWRTYGERDASGVKLFSVERRGCAGSRRFLASHMDAMISTCIRAKPEHRNYYEILREDTPCHLFFDLEFSRRNGLNAHVDGNLLTAVLLHRIVRALTERFAIEAPHRADVLQLESSTAFKFSRHLVIRLAPPSAVAVAAASEISVQTGAAIGPMFRDVVTAGRFVQHLVERLSRERASDPLIDALWLETEKSSGAMNARMANDAAAYVGHDEFAIDAPIDWVPSEAMSVTADAASEARAVADSTYIRDNRAAKRPRAIPTDAAHDNDNDAYKTAKFNESDDAESESRANDSDNDRKGTTQCSIDNGSPSLNTSTARAPGRTFIADLGVYTRNRAMRCAFACKRGKVTSLLPAACNAFAVPGGSNDSALGDPASFNYWLHACRVPPQKTADGPTIVRRISGESIDSGMACGDGDVQIGSLDWEVAIWRASLITDALPPLSISCRAHQNGQATCGLPAAFATTGDGIPSTACLSCGAASGARCRPALHPTTRGRLLYVEENPMHAPTAVMRSEQLSLVCSRDAAYGCMATLGAPSGHNNSRIVQGGSRPIPLPRLAQWVCKIACGPISDFVVAAQHVRSGLSLNVTAQAGTASESSACYGASTLQMPAVRSWVRGWSCSVRTSAPSSPQSYGASATSDHSSIDDWNWIQYELGGTHWCHRVGRHHRSNHIAWRVHLRDGVAMQRCWDADCRAAMYCSPPVRVPPGLVVMQPRSHATGTTALPLDGTQPRTFDASSVWDSITDDDVRQLMASNIA